MRGRSTPGRSQVNYQKPSKAGAFQKTGRTLSGDRGVLTLARRGLFARGQRNNWKCWGIELEEYLPTWDTYANHSQASNPVYISKVKEAKPDEKPILAPAMFIEKALKRRQRAES